MSFEFDMSAFERGMAGMEKRIKKAAVDGMTEVTYDLQAKAVDLAPLYKAGLRNSAWSEISESGGTVTGEVFFSAAEKDGDGRFNYALYQHELGGTSEKYKNPSTPGTQPKFLERPLKENADEYVERIGEIIEREMRR